MYAWPARNQAPSKRQRARFWCIYARLQCRCNAWTSAFGSVFYCIQSIPQSETHAIIDAHALFSEIAAALDYFEQSRASLTVVLDGLPLIAAQHGDVTDLRCVLLAKRAIRHVARSDYPAAMDDIREAAQMLEDWFVQQGHPLRDNACLVPHAVIGDTITVRFEGYPEHLQSLSLAARNGQDARSANWRFAAVVVPWTIAFIKYWWARSDLQANQTEMPESYHLAVGALKAGQDLIPGHQFLVRASSLVTDIPVSAGWSAEMKTMRAVWLSYTSAGRRLLQEVLADVAQNPLYSRECRWMQTLAELYEKALSQRLLDSPDFTSIIRDVNALRREAQNQTNGTPTSYHLVARCLFLLSGIYAIRTKPSIAYPHAQLALRAFTHQTAGEAFLPRVQHTQLFMSSLAKPIG